MITRPSLSIRRLAVLVAGVVLASAGSARADTVFIGDTTTVPSQFTGGEGAVTGQEVRFNLSFSSALELPADQLPDRTGATLVLGTHRGDGSADTLAPWEARVLRLA